MRFILLMYFDNGDSPLACIDPATKWLFWIDQKTKRKDYFLFLCRKEYKNN